MRLEGSRVAGGFPKLAGPQEQLTSFYFNSSPRAFSEVHFIVSLCFFSLFLL